MVVLGVVVGGELVDVVGGTVFLVEVVGGVVFLVEVDVVEVAPHAPVIDGTASTPFPIATRLVPQLSAVASQRFSLSWS